MAIPLALLYASASWAQSIQTDGDVETDGQLISNAPEGTPPLAVSSTTVVPGLNADQVDGLEAAAFALDVDLQAVEALLLALDGDVDALALGLARVARTGQSTCYDETGAVTACGSGVGVGQDGDLQSGLAWPSPRFTDNADGTVTDNLTALVWLADADCFGLKSWADALSESNALFDGSTNDPMGGDCALSDGSSAGEWRLPNAREVQSLADYGFVSPAVPNTAGTGQWAAADPFLDVQSAAYWTSTTRVGGADAFSVDLTDGSLATGAKTGTLRVWPVRDGS